MDVRVATALAEELNKYRTAFRSSASFLSNRKTIFDENWILVTALHRAYVTDQMIDALLEAEPAIANALQSIKDFRFGGRMLQVGKDTASSVLSKKSMVTVRVRDDLISLKLQRPPVQRVEQSGTRVNFSNLPEELYQDKADENLLSWAKQLIQFDKNNEVVDIHKVRPTNRDDVETFRIRVTFRAPPRCLVVHEAAAIASGTPFTRNITMDDYFDGPRYAWVHNNKSCSHCHVTGHGSPECPVKEIPWPQPSGQQKVSTSTTSPKTLPGAKNLGFPKPSTTSHVSLAKKPNKATKRKPSPSEIDHPELEVSLIDGFRRTEEASDIQPSPNKKMRARSSPTAAAAKRRSPQLTPSSFPSLTLGGASFTSYLAKASPHLFPNVATAASVDLPLKANTSTPAGSLASSGQTPSQPITISSNEPSSPANSLDKPDAHTSANVNQAQTHS